MHTGIPLDFTEIRTIYIVDPKPKYLKDTSMALGKKKKPSTFTKACNKCTVSIFTLDNARGLLRKHDYNTQFFNSEVPGLLLFKNICKAFGTDKLKLLSTGGTKHA